MLQSKAYTEEVLLPGHTWLLGLPFIISCPPQTCLGDKQGCPTAPRGSSPRAAASQRSLLSSCCKGEKSTRREEKTWAAPALQELRTLTKAICSLQEQETSPGGLPRKAAFYKLTFCCLQCIRCPLKDLKKNMRVLSACMSVVHSCLVLLQVKKNI